MSLRGLARAWDVHYRTFRNRVVGKVTAHGHASGRRTVLSAKEESELAELVMTMADVGIIGLKAFWVDSQNCHLVMFASRALSSAETRYAQIEKELLATVFACTKFDMYIYGRSTVKSRNVRADCMNAT